MQKILKISSAGAASTFIDNFTQYVNAGNKYVYEIAVDKDANLYFGDIGGIHKLTSGGALTLIAQDYQKRFAVDKNEAVIFPITDNTQKTEIVRVSPQGTQSVVVSSSQVSFTQVGDIAADKWGNIFISNVSGTQQNSIYAVNADNNLFTVISSADGHVDGALATAKIYGPFYLSTDATGNLYFFEASDFGVGNNIRKITF